MTSITDAQGLVTTLKYDPTAAANGQGLLTSVTDPAGGTLTLGYNSNKPLQITSVTRSGDGLSAHFNYAGTQLTSITDTIGITSTFHYVTGTSFIDKLTTPYGVTTFHSADTASSLEADMTNPLGQTERVEYQESLSTALVAASDASVPTATGLAVDNTNLNTANTFYWSRRAMADATAGSITTDSAPFYALAETTHWAQSGEGSMPVPLCTKKRLEGRVWYNYPAQPDVDHVDVTAAGSTTSPSITARLLDSGSTQVYKATYSNTGLITQSIDPAGRTTTYSYDPNTIDLLTVTQTDGGSQDLLSTMTYNSQHEPLTVKDASGQTTTMTYFPNGQLHTRTDAKSETTTLAYNGSYYLASVTGPVSGATTSYTYDSVGRVHIVTDSEGYALTTAYDNLDRPVTVTYPDATTDKTIYHILDVGKTIDRQGRVTTSQYDAIRELLQTTDPLGRTTKYSWCTCGGLATLTDANNNLTTWGLDGQGRVTSKTYADSTAINYVYETNTSRLHTMTDARGSVATYAYNADNTLSGTSYALGSGVSTTPNVSFAYDTIYNRVSTMTDGTGTTTYTYNPITTTPTLGAGRLGSVSSPIAGASAAVAYTYDELGRVTNRTVDGANAVGTTFDTLGRVTNVSNPLGAFVYAYVNTTGRLSGVTYPTGTTLTTSYSYFPNSGDQRLQEIKNLKGSTPLSKFDYTYNAVGTIATWTQQADSGTAVVNTLSYDGADQLINAVQTGGATASNAYKYDPAGNRLAETTATTTTSGQFNNLNQLKALTSSSTTQPVAGHTTALIVQATIDAWPATITNGTNFSVNVFLPSGTNVLAVTTQDSTGVTSLKRFSTATTGSAPTALTYDLNGNTVTDESGNSYQWDALNRLTKITYPSTAYSTFAYDGLSRRTQIAEYNSTHVLTNTKNYLWIGQEMAEERDATNTVQKRFFPQGEQQSGTNYYYTKDHLGSTREMCDGAGNIVSRLSYDPYGRMTVVSGTNLPTKQYANYYAHATSGLYLTKYRAFDSNMGRWLSRDPIGENGGYNLYEYCMDDPTCLLDPAGKSCAAWGIAGGVVGAGIGAVLGIESGPGDAITISAGWIWGSGAAGALLGCAAGNIDLTHVSPITITIPRSSNSGGSDSNPRPPQSVAECKKGGSCEYFYAWCLWGSLHGINQPGNKWIRSQAGCLDCYIKCKTTGKWNCSMGRGPKWLGPDNSSYPDEDKTPFPQP